MVESSEFPEVVPARSLAAVTVVIPCYKDAGTIERAVGSVLAQTMPPAEVIIVDDFSDDSETSLALDRLSEHAPFGLRVIRLSKNSGPAVARNTGWEAATQDYVAFLDADDVWAQRKLEIQFPQMQGDPTLAMSGHKMDVWSADAGASSRAEQSHAPLRRISFTRLLFRNPLGTPSVILKRDIPYRFNPERRYSEDYELWLRITLKYGEFGFLDESLSFMHKRAFGESGLSSNLPRMEAGQTAVYMDLFRERAFRWPMLLALLTWAKVRYARRIALTLFWKTFRGRPSPG